MRLQQLRQEDAECRGWADLSMRVMRQKQDGKYCMGFEAENEG